MSKRVKIMRKRVTDKKWLLKRRGSLIEEARHWSSFETFECSVFFRGEICAAHNTAIMKKAMARVERQLNFINRLLTVKVLTK